MKLWTWLKAKNVMKDIKQLKDKKIIVKRCSADRPYSTYVHSVQKIHMADDKTIAVFSEEGFWVWIYNPDEIMILL